MENDSKLMRGVKPFVFTNCKSGEGIEQLVRVIRKDLLFDYKLAAREQA
jgi:urease accessory protein